MNPYDIYITPEEYEQAEANGICQRLLNKRIRSYGWGKQRAMTEAPRKMNDRRELLKIAASNGVGRTTFQTRIARGWAAEKAANTPPFSEAEKIEQLKRMADGNRIIPIEVRELAAQNGIGYKTLSSRVFRIGWPLERAATEPIWSREKRAKYAGERFKEIYGSKFGTVTKY